VEGNGLDVCEDVHIAARRCPLVMVDLKPVLPRTAVPPREEHRDER
jgi:hypothetical protein